MNNIAQKFVGIGVLMLFVMSIVPLALAVSDDSGVDGSDSDGVGVGVGVDVSTTLDGDDVAVNASASSEVERGRMGVRAEMRDQRKDAREDIKDARENVREVRSEVKGARMDIRESRILFHEERKVAREEMKINRDEILALKGEYKKCSGVVCDELKVKFNHGVKNHVKMLLIQIDRSFEQLKERVEISGALRAEDKTQILADIAVLEEKIAAKRIEVEAFPENATKEELKVAVKELQQFVIDVRQEQRKVVVMLISSKVDSMIVRQDALAAAMQLKIDGITSAGGDASKLIELRATFVEQTATIKNDQDDARAAWLVAESKSDKHDIWVKAHGKVKNGFEESRDVLREFMQVYKGLKSHTTQSSEAVDNVEVNASTEADVNVTLPEVNTSVNTSVDTSVDTLVNASVNVTAEASQ